MTAGYVQRFAHLNANKNRRHWTAETTHRAPHKPLLLLAVIDRFAQGSIHANLIQLDTELVELFGLYRGRVRPPSPHPRTPSPLHPCTRSPLHPRNGIALCHLCHWTFDKGLITVNGRYTVVTSPQLTTNPNVPGHLVTLNGRGMISPAERPLWPDVDALTWHGREVFRRR